MSDVVAMEDGTIALGLLEESEIRLFDAAGRYLRTLGRKGRGPGEFQAVWQVLSIADSIVGVDGFGVGQLFVASGQHVRMLPRPTAFGSAVRLIGYTPDGRLVGYLVRQPEQVPVGRTKVTATVVILDGSSVSELGTFPSHEIARSPGGEPAPIAFGARAQFVVVGRSFCVTSSQGEYELGCFDMAGRPTIRLRRPGSQRRPVGSNDRLSYFAAIDSANPGPRGTSYRAQVRKTTSFAEQFAAIGRLVGTAAGHLWVGPPAEREGTLALNPLPDKSTSWSVYSANGRWLADAVLPPGFRLLAVRDGHAIGLAQDHEGAEQVLILPLVPAPPP